jgi:putative ABC transport system permease protein
MHQQKNISGPPPWIEKWLENLIDPYLLEGIQGDLYEKYYLISTQKSSFRANLSYIWNAIGYIRYFSLKSKNSRSNIEAMFKNYLTITLRSFKKHKVYSFINLFGLAVGITAGFIILQYVYYEFNYDTHLQNRENIYRVQQDRYNKGELTTQWAAGCAGIGPDLKEAFPEVDKYVKLHVSGASLKYNNRYLDIKHPYYASEDFFEVFSIRLLSGVDSLVLKEAYKVVISESTAKNIFGNEDPLGKIIIQSDNRDFEVVGVFEDIPEHSHMKIDLLYSFKTYVALTDEGANTQWNWDGFMTYVKLKNGSNPQALEAKIPTLVQTKKGEDYETTGEGIEFHLQPIDKIHLTSDYIMEFKANGNEQTTYFLLIIGIFLIAIAWINYINLTTARSMQRAKEVGIRKVLGSHRSQLVKQFMFESVFINLISIIISALLIAAIYPYFNQFVGISNPYTIPEAPIFWMVFLGILLLGTILSGFYPALVLSGFKPISVLKGKFESTGSGNVLRKSLVIIQFLTSVILITGTFAVYRQMDFLQDQDLGVATEQTMIINTPNVNSDSLYNIQYDLFRNNLLSESDINKVSSSSAVPGRQPGWNAGGVRLLEQGEDEANQYRVIMTDDEYMKLYELELASGRVFDKSYGDEDNNVLINEASIKLLGMKDAESILNKKMQFWGDTFNIVGVLKNFRQESPKSAFDPLVFRYGARVGGFYSLKLSSNNIGEVVDKVEKHWQTAFASKPLTFFFLDDYYNEQYKSEIRFGTIFSIFSGLAILVACMGLFGLASYATALRTKEVSVRKVLGAQMSQLFLLLTKDFLKLVGISILISLPISIWIINLWLDNFANRISLNAVLFVIPALVLALIAVVTIAYHTYKTATLNPATTLKDE